MRIATPAWSEASLLAVEDVTAIRRNGRTAALLLDRVSFDIAAGEYLGLRGPRRSGKTTLLRIAAGIDQPKQGRVAWRGVATTDLPRRKRTHRLREIAFASLDWRGAPGKPMLDHIALPLVLDGMPLPEALAAAFAAAEELDAEHYVHAPPQELPPDALLRLALARALVRRPGLLIVDGVGEGADAEHQTLQRQLLALVREHQQMALLVASRDATALRGADRVMSLDGSGRLRVPDCVRARVLPFPTEDERS